MSEHSSHGRKRLQPAFRMQLTSLWTFCRSDDEVWILLPSFDPLLGRIRKASNYRYFASQQPFSCRYWSKDDKALKVMIHSLRFFVHTIAVCKFPLSRRWSETAMRSKIVGRRTFRFRGFASRHFSATEGPFAIHTNPNPNLANTVQYM